MVPEEEHKRWALTRVIVSPLHHILYSQKFSLTPATFVLQKYFVELSFANTVKVTISSM